MRIEDPWFEKHEAAQDLVQWIRAELELAGGAETGDRDRKAASFQKSKPRVSRLLLKAPVPVTDPGGLTSDEVFASRTFDERQAQANILVGESVAGSWRPGPMNSSLAVRLEDATGALVASGQPKPLSALTISEPVFLAPKKSVAIIATTKELVRPGKAEAFINGALRAAEVAATNAAIVALIKASTSLTVAATGPQDILSLAFAELTSGTAASRYFIAVAPDVGRAMGGAMGASGLLFPQFDPAKGGKVGTMNAYVTDALAAGEGLLVDASGFAADPGSLRFDFTGQATLEMSDAPTQNAATPVNQVSLWQSNSVATLCERFFAFEALRDDAAVLVTSIT